jgi:hypothetical protein
MAGVGDQSERIGNPSADRLGEHIDERQPERYL